MDSEDIFLRGIWKLIPDEESTEWVKRVANMPGTNAPLGDFGPIVKDMLDKGVSTEEIARFARIIGYETAFNICYHLEDPNASYEGFDDSEQTRIQWELYKINAETEEPIERLTGLHESLLMMDPSGREMAPK